MPLFVQGATARRISLLSSGLIAGAISAVAPQPMAPRPMALWPMTPVGRLQPIVIPSCDGPLTPFSCYSKGLFRDVATNFSRPEPEIRSKKVPLD